MSITGLRTLLPNLISLARLLAVPVAVYVILQGQYALAFWIFVAAGVSDAVDGFLAKRFNAVRKAMHNVVLPPPVTSGITRRVLWAPCAVLVKSAHSLSITAQSTSENFCPRAAMISRIVW